MGNEDESIEGGNSSNDNDTVWTSQEKDDEEAREELPSVVPKDPNHEIPNGGFKAWLQVLGSFFLFFNSWLVLLTYHVLFTCHPSIFSLNFHTYWD